MPGGIETLFPQPHLIALPANDEGAENFFPHTLQTKDTFTDSVCDIVRSGWGHGGLYQGRPATSTHAAA